MPLTQEEVERLYEECRTVLIEEFQPVAYVAGPYRATTEWGLERNIRLAEGIAINLWSMGYAAICPHKNTANFGGAKGLPDQVWLDGDLSILSRCDLLVAVPGWERSKGTVAELTFATEHGIPVLFWELPEDRVRLSTFDFRSVV
jgi:hypothetical protein